MKYQDQVSKFCFGRRSAAGEDRSGEVELARGVVVAIYRVSSAGFVAIS
jgi:hypothetical protein